VVPGRPEALAVEAKLIDAGTWSRYLEVATEPGAEIFTQAPVLSTVGLDARIGTRSDPAWNDPELEVVAPGGSAWA
jgi:fumarylacetoacetate (FAA) hydrolase family protein